MSSNEPRDQLAELIADQGIDLRRDIPVNGWPADEAAMYAEMAPEKHTAERVNWDRQEARRAAIQRLRCEKVADALLSAGWQPPPRRIATAELDTMRPGTLLREATTGRVYERRAAGYWIALNGPAIDVYAPMHRWSVLWEPEEGDQ